MNLRTEPYTISRSTLALWAAKEYAMRLWWVFIAIPVSGLIFLASDFRLLQGLGLFGVLWPLSIPARSVFVTNRAAKRWGTETTLAVEGNHVYFISKDPSKGMRLKISSIRHITDRGTFYVLTLPKMNLVFVPKASFSSDEDRTSFMSLAKFPSA